MKRKLFPVIVISLVLLMTLAVAVSIEASQGSREKKGPSGEDIFYTILAICLLGGSFVLLPLIIYTNNEERIFFPAANNQDQLKPLTNLTEAERNERARMILAKIEEKLYHYQDEDGNDLITVHSGKQAKFTKRGLDYINKRLTPADPEIIDRVNELAKVYTERMKRVFTGSKWIIACSSLFLIFMLFNKVWSTFIVFALGLAFYILASRMTMYGMEKMMNWKGTIKIGCVAAIFSVLWTGMNTSYYRVYKSGRKEMDLESTLGSGAIYLILAFAAVLILAMLTPIIGMLNFILNYSTSLLIPFVYDEDKWYQENFS